MQTTMWTTLAVAALAGTASATTATPSLVMNASEAIASAASSQAAQPAAGSSFWTGWKRSADIGLNGSQGNTDNLNVRGALGAVRDAADMTTAAGISYIYGSQDSTKTKSKGEAFIRNDWKLEKPWGWYAIGKLEYDEFQAWQWRISGATGPSYLLIDSEVTMLKLRAGIGASYETGKQAKEELTAEINLGFDLTHKFTERTKGFITFDYYANLNDFPEYRHVTSAGLEVNVDPTANMFLKLGAQNRYDSRSRAPVKKNDLDYFLTLGWTF
jgi:hypothetical protein